MKTFLTRFALAAIAFTTHANAVEDSQIGLIEVPKLSTFPQPTAKGAIQLACSHDITELREFFFSQNLPFQRDMVRLIQGVPCHIYYQPTLPGFRAASESDPVQSLSFGLDPLQFVIAGEQSGGGALGVIRELTENISRPLKIELNLPFQHEKGFYESRKREHFDESIHNVSLQDRGQANCLWAQDLMKPGFYGGTTKLLVPYRLFEGDSNTGKLFDPIIKDLCRSKGVVRSKLSWEGGDLLFTRDPLDPQRLILFYGAAAKIYWGNALTPREYEYILSLEFGADRAVDLSGLAPHVDYFVAFLPDERTALVSEMQVGDSELARVAVERLLGLFKSSPPRELHKLQGHLREFSRKSAGIEALLRRVRESSSRWRFGIDQRLWPQLNSLVESMCPQRIDCFSLENQREMLRDNPRLLGLWVKEANQMRMEREIIQVHLDLIETLIRRLPDSHHQRREERIRELENLGFRIIRTPRLGGRVAGDDGWPGISYVNCLIVDKQIFVPEFGLGTYEDRIFSDLQVQLPAGYSVIPVPAADVLVRNGGIHCLTAVIRGRDTPVPE